MSSTFQLQTLNRKQQCSVVVFIIVVVDNNQLVQCVVFEFRAAEQSGSVSTQYSKKDATMLWRWVMCCLLAAVAVRCDQWPFADGDEYTLAQINITYVGPTAVHTDSAEMGKFGTGRVGSTAGILIHVRSGNSSSHHGCELTYDNELPVIRHAPVESVLFLFINFSFSFFAWQLVPWIALVRRGRCNFDDKLEAAFLNNASGLVVYNNKEDGLQKMTLRNKYRT